MHRKGPFLLTLAAFVLVYLAYGLYRLRLGVDFTDEGAYLAWPLRTLLGERPFSSDPLTLFRPIEAYLFIPFRLHPGMTLYEFRLIGWLVHLTAFGVLSCCLFRLSDAPLQSPLVASVPFFVAHIFGNALPSYNPLSSDFLVMALSLRVLATHADRRQIWLHLASGLALFVATFAHPALGVVAALMLMRELGPGKFTSNLVRRQLTASNAGMLAFLVCWVAFATYFVGSGALTDWLRRLPLAGSGNALNDPMGFFGRLAVYPFTHSPIAWGLTLASLTAVAFLVSNARRGADEPSRRTAAIWAGLLVAALVATFSFEPEFLPVRLAQVCLILIALFCVGPRPAQLRVDPEIRFLLLMAGLGAVLCATTTFYFSPARSWLSGILALPFAFGVGLTLLLKNRPARPPVLRLLMPGVLALAVVCVGWIHYNAVQRDGLPTQLLATFQIPKLRSIRSTPERVTAVEALHAYLGPKLARGEPLLAFDDCPLLYYLFDAMPAYGLTWAVRYTQTPAVLRQLNAELNARPLPRYAIRTIVDLSHATWRSAPRTNYANYPLNETVEARYTLEKTIFPFEIWRLKSAGR